MKATPNDCEALAKAMSRAFINEPYCRWLFPSDKDWINRSEQFFTYDLKHGLRYGNLSKTEDNGAAMQWAFVGQNEEKNNWSDFEYLWHTFLQFGLRTRDIYRVFDLFKKHMPDAPFVYIEFLGVDPDKQGRGYGKAMIEYAIAESTKNNCPVYLETCDEKTVRFYEKLGFSVSNQFDFAPGAKAFCMIRR